MAESASLVRDCRVSEAKNLCTKVINLPHKHKIKDIIQYL